MAGCVYTITTSSEIALESGVDKGMIKLISNTGVNYRIKEWGVYFKGVSSTSPPILCTIFACSTTGSWTSNTPKQRSGAINTTITGRLLSKINCQGALPQTSGIYAQKEVHPQLGYQEKFAPGEEIEFGIGNSNALCLVVNSPTTLECVAEIVCEE